MPTLEQPAVNGQAVERVINATPATEWRRQRTDGDLFVLPGSGNVARLRRVSLTALAAAGAIPNDTADRVLRLMAIEIKAEQLSDEQQLAVYKRNQRAFIDVAARCLVAPVLIVDGAPDYERDQIGPDDLADRDYTWLFYSWINGTADQVSPFRCDHQQPRGLHTR